MTIPNIRMDFSPEYREIQKRHKSTDSILLHTRAKRRVLKANKKLLKTECFYRRKEDFRRNRERNFKGELFFV
jgi:hypothetical protein